MEASVNKLRVNIKTKSCGIYKIAFFAAVSVHIIFFIFNLVSGSEHIDEVMAILNARSIAENGTDILGERLPVYFDTWLYGGQSPFATYVLALFFKAFGYSLFTARLPMLLFSIAGLAAYHGFLKEVFPNNIKLAEVSFIILAFSPWHIAHATYVLDCNFMPHIFIMGLCFLAKGVNSGKAGHYILSMIFFGLCFYCYIASVLIVPPFLLIIYIILLAKKKISFKNTAVSVISIFLTALAFILFGLVYFGVIKEFTLFGFSFSQMPYYQRSASISLSNIPKKLSTLLAALILPDAYIFINHGMNGFIYTNCFGGIFFVFGSLYLIKRLLKKSNEKIELDNFPLYAVALLITAFIFAIMSIELYALYRFFSYNYILSIIEAVGIIIIAKRLKKSNLKRVLCIFLSFSVAMFTAEFIVHNTNKLIYENQVYIKALDNSLDYADELGFDKIGIVLADKNVSKSPEVRNQDTAIVLRYHYYNYDKFLDLKNELLSISAVYGTTDGEPAKLTSDDSLYYKRVDNEPIDDDCLVLYYMQLEYINYDESEYEIKNFGKIDVLYKKA